MSMLFSFLRLDRRTAARLSAIKTARELRRLAAIKAAAEESRRAPRPERKTVALPVVTMAQLVNGGAS